MKKKNKNSPGKKVLKYSIFAILILLLVLFIINYELVVSVFKNLPSIWKGLMSDSEDIKAQIEQNEKDTVDALTGAGVNISKEDFDKINSGKLSADEISDIISGGMDGSGAKDDNIKPDASGEIPEQPSNSDEQNKDGEAFENTEDEPDTPEGTDGQNDKPVQVVPDNPEKDNTEPGDEPQQSETISESEYNKKVSDLVAKMYVIKSDFLAKLDEFEARIKAEYSALPKEKQTTATKADIVSANMSYITGLEAQCDAQVKAVTDELTALMVANGKDTALVDAINTAYKNEKELKKSYYISLYK